MPTARFVRRVFRRAGRRSAAKLTEYGEKPVEVAEISFGGTGFETLSKTDPPAVKAVRGSGAVNVQFTVDEEGKVISANAVTGHPLPHSSAEEAARNAEFNPTVLSGTAVKTAGLILYNFNP